MPSSVASTIRHQLARYLRGEITLRDFDAWFVPATWGVTQDDDPAAYDLTNEIYLRLAEYSAGHRTEQEVQEMLRSLTTPAPVAG